MIDPSLSRSSAMLKQEVPPLPLCPQVILYAHSLKKMLPNFISSKHQAFCPEVCHNSGILVYHVYAESENKVYLHRFLDF
jgi:hypothetical protein